MLGVHVDAMDMDSLFSTVQDIIVANKRCIIANHNLHSIFLFHHDQKMRAFYQLAEYTFIDGMALVFLGRLVGLPLKRQNRMTAVDWLRPLLRRAAEERWQVFFLGSKPGVADKAIKILRSEIPGLNIAGTHGYFDAAQGSPESVEILSKIRAYRPDVLIVGMGMPRQEHWIHDELNQIEARVILNQGAFMELIVGDLPVPPRWAARIGIEWVFRLMSRPGRVWRRYLVEPWLLLPRFLHELVDRRFRRGG